MAKRRITAELVERMKPGETYFDTEVSGFAVRHRGGDARYFLKTRIKGRQTILGIGKHGRGYWGPEKARREAIRLLGLIRDGRDITTERAEDRAAPTLAAFSEIYMRDYVLRRKKASTAEAYRRNLTLHLLPVLGKKKIREITRADASRLHAKMAETPIAANRTLALLSGIMSYAEKRGERPEGTNPARYVEPFPEQGRERYLKAEELTRLSDVLASAEDRRLCDWRPVAIVRLLILTGARLDEIVGLQWDVIDVERGVARLSDSKTGPKNLVLPAPALAILAELPRTEGNPHVIPGNIAGGAFQGIQKAWQRIRAAAELPGVRLHDLRHSYASAAISAGDSLYIIGRLLGHAHASTTQRYAHLAPDPARAAADRNAERLVAMMSGGKDAEVIQIDPKRRHKASAG